MRFLAITLQGIRNFDEKTIHFQDGLNVVCGPNESGKSTIVDSLLYAITGGGEVSSLIQRKAEYSKIDVQYETDAGQMYTVTRIIHPEEKSRLENNAIVEDLETIYSILKDHFGSTNKVVLENSAVVKHNEMEIMREMGSKEAMRKQIQAVLAGGSKRSVEEVIDILERDIFQAERSLVDLEIRAEQVLQRLEPYEGVDDRHERLKGKKAVYEEDVARYEKILEVYTGRLLYGDLVKEVKECEKIRDQIEDIEGYIRGIPFEEVEKIEKLRVDMEQIEEKKEGFYSLIEKREEELEKYEKDLKDGQGGFFSRVFGSLLGKPKGRNELERQIDLLKGLLEKDRSNVRELEERYQGIREEVHTLEKQMGSYRSESKESLNRMEERYNQEMEGLLQGRTKEEFSNLIFRKETERDELRSAIFLSDPELLGKDDQYIRDGKQELERKRELLTEEIRSIEGELAVTRSKKGEKDRIQSDLNLVNAQKEGLESKRDVDQVVLDTIRVIYRDLKEQFVPQLEDRAGEILQRITRGKYEKVSIRKEDFEVFVELPGQILDTHSLSQGTKDQLHLSLRIALSELVSGGRNLPLLFDESFYTSDRKRLEETFTLLKEIAHRTQVILFTHNEDFLQYGHAVMLSDAEEKEEFQQLY